MMTVDKSEGKKSLGQTDNNFLELINLIFLATTSPMIYHCLSAWKTGVYINPKDFNLINGISRYMLTLYRPGIYADKKSPWLC
jgi:hypothetical protein